MKNRAKCKLCNEILESLHTYDYVTCKCGEISISGGTERLECSAKDWKNFLRIDENGHEIVVKVKDGVEPPEPKEQDMPVMTRNDKIKMLEAMIQNIDNLPEHAKLQAINHLDMFSYMAVVLSIFKDEKNS